MENTTRGVEKNCGCCLVRPYVNDQVLTKIYNLECALKYGTIFPELNLYDSKCTIQHYIHHLKKE